MCPSIQKTLALGGSDDDDEALPPAMGHNRGKYGCVWLRAHNDKEGEDDKRKEGQGMALSLLVGTRK